MDVGSCGFGVREAVHGTPLSTTADAEFRYERMLGRVLAVLVACLFYATGNFGLLNVFDGRRTIQALLLASLMPFGAVVLKRRAWIRNPVWWLVALTVIAQIVIRTD